MSQRSSTKASSRLPSIHRPTGSAAAVAGEAASTKRKEGTSVRSQRSGGNLDDDGIPLGGAAGGMTQSIASSEYYSRLEALTLQLQAEAERRRAVEKAIQKIASSKSAPNPDAEGASPRTATTPRSERAVAIPTALPLRASSLMAAASNDKAGGVESWLKGQTKAGETNTAGSASKPPKASTKPGKPPLAKGSSSTSPPKRRSSMLDDVAGDSLNIPKHIKPSLPKQARGTTAPTSKNGRRKVPLSAMYVNQLRHQQREEKLARFEQWGTL